MKDNFSSQSDKYAKYRPTYPLAFFGYLNSIVLSKQNAWDCGTGNGQVAYELAKIFNNVFATDVSQSQIDNALRTDNIT
jgi:methylase of polypeptide subunit release factors